MAEYIGAVDQGTTSTRFIIFDREGRIVGLDQKEHEQIFPRPGWVEHDPLEIWNNTRLVIQGALAKAGIAGADLAAVGITNQRETTVLWDRDTGRPYCNAIVWQCTRTDHICRELVRDGGQDRFREKTGLPVATYFSGPKIKWILDNNSEARAAALRGKACFGTMETWVIWWLTGGPEGGTHVTDVTNASRTMLMDLRSLKWDEEILDRLGIPEQILPRIVPSSDSDYWGFTAEDGPAGARIPVCGALGDQQAALVGQHCFEPGQAKNTYGTGCFLLLNTGEGPVTSKHGLITTVAYQRRGHEPIYALEGSIAIAGALVQWLRDNIGLISEAPQVEDLARTVEDSGGVYIVPAFSGLFAPYWRSDARGAMVGLTRYANRGHIARAVLEACAYQTRDIVEAMNKDSGVELAHLKVDGGMVFNDLLMQFQADTLGVPVIRPRVAETTCLGAAYAAGLATGFWSGFDELTRNWKEDKRWDPAMDQRERAEGYRGWKKAVERTFNWVE
ncbi:MAG: glycerol kinase GlpK [Deltaproteobacteria bacterium]|nr:glycerol kinase GlpK [Deltaproteobacteria bacterium]MBW2049203.1 glycerol kinase GlpK [Deltaproteobacteria bacterium]MBW2110825.1 glycerol kinase GlpK [Deltaproteobacteria bacterium]MBW2354278.1 glycerol kinase GlpK [Deltaproteobacteria bacterium]HDZ90745.1 glycerol kinase [Deltaproteobacteria bacterium]